MTLKVEKMFIDLDSVRSMKFIDTFNNHHWSLWLVVISLDRSNAQPNHKILIVHMSKDFEEYWRVQVPTMMYFAKKSILCVQKFLCSQGWSVIHFWIVKCSFYFGYYGINGSFLQISQLPQYFLVCPYILTRCFTCLRLRDVQKPRQNWTFHYQGRQLWV